MAWRASALAVFLVVLIAGLARAAGSASTLAPQAYLPVVSNPPSVTPTPIPFFSDDFSNPASGWPTGTDGTVTRAYTNGEYQILFQQGSITARSGHDLTATDFDARVDVRSAATSSDTLGTAGLYFGETSAGYYDFEIGYPNFYLARYDSTTNQLTYLIYLTPAWEIFPGTATNVIEVNRSGSLITLSINGQQVGQVHDSTFGTGSVGLIATATFPGFDARFDNVNVSFSGVTPTPVAFPSGTATPTPIASQTAEAVAFQENVAHDGSTTQPGLTLPFQKLWTASIQGVPGYALIADGRVYASSVTNTYSDGWLYAFDATSGSTAWGPVSVPENGDPPYPAYDNGSIFVPTAASGPGPLSTDLRSFDAGSGTLRWTTTLPIEPFPNTIPVAAQGIVYVSPGGLNTVLFAVSASDGSILWSKALDGSGAAPVLAPDGVLVGYGCDAYKFQRSTGAMLWHNVSPRCVGGGLAESAYYQSRLYEVWGSIVLDASSGQQIGSFLGYCVPAFAGNVGIVQLPGAGDGRVVGFDAATGATLWTFAPSDPPANGQPLVINGEVFVGSQAGKIYALDPASGSVIWTGDTGTASPVTSLTAGDNILVALAGDTVVAFGGSSSALGATNNATSGVMAPRQDPAGE